MHRPLQKNFTKILEKKTMKNRLIKAIITLPYNILVSKYSA